MGTRRQGRTAAAPPPGPGTPRHPSPVDALIDTGARPENRRRSFGWDLALLAQILGWGGVAERVGAATEPDRYDPKRQRLVGGTLQLTPVGRWWLASGT